MIGKAKSEGRIVIIRSSRSNLVGALLLILGFLNEKSALLSMIDIEGGINSSAYCLCIAEI